MDNGFDVGGPTLHHAHIDGGIHGRATKDDAVSGRPDAAKDHDVDADHVYWNVSLGSERLGSLLDD